MKSVVIAGALLSLAACHHSHSAKSTTGDKDKKPTGAKWTDSAEFYPASRHQDRDVHTLQEALKNDKATKEAKTADGFVHSGDAGFIDDEGHLRIIDRAKDVGRMKDGTMFPPKFIENKLKFFPFIKEAVAFGHKRDQVTAMISISGSLISLVKLKPTHC